MDDDREENVYDISEFYEGCLGCWAGVNEYLEPAYYSICQLANMMAGPPFVAPQGK